MPKRYLCPPDTSSLALDRVREALGGLYMDGYEPDVWINQYAEHAADLVVLQVVGRRDAILRKAHQIKKSGRKYAVIQYVLRSSQKPAAHDWMELWESAAAVWSYLPLTDWCSEEQAPTRFNFYHAPLGVDADVFRPSLYVTRERDPITVITSGRHWLTESVRECVLAADTVGGEAVHLGPEMRGRDVSCYSGLNDESLATLYSQCQYVSGLRRIEGFELPAAEGLLCGARPILFDAPHYRRWYRDSGIYLRESDRQGVIEQLVDLFKQPVNPVTRAERDEAARIFHWPTIIKGFWERCGA